MTPSALPELPPVFVPDGRGPWAVRYHWIQHERNEEFLANYFADDSVELKLNLRNMTADQKHLWVPHNATLARAEISGDMVWRVKTINHAARSIDHMEVWRSREVLHSYFHTEYPEWTYPEREALSTMLRERGFIIRAMDHYPLISRSQALQLYLGFVKAVAQKETRIETRLKYS